MRPFLSGDRYTRLTITAEPYRDGKYRRVECRCDCGNMTTPYTHALTKGDAKSCGCLHAEKSAERCRKRLTTHGQRSTPLYAVWRGMIDRCENPKNNRYKYYGARGIKVCERWHKFENFFADMGPRPIRDDRMTLERLDGDKDYEPGNVVWATYKVQNNNKRKVVA